MYTELRASCLVTSSPFQTKSKQPLFVSALLRCGRWVWSRVPRVGPGGLQPSFASWQLGWTGSRVSCTSQVPAAPPVSRLKDPKISPMHPSSMFFQAWSHSGEKTIPSSSQSSPLSQQRPTCDRKTQLQTARCQDSFDKSVIKMFFWIVLNNPHNFSAVHKI